MSTDRDDDKWETFAACKEWPQEYLDDFFPLSEDGARREMKLTKPPVHVMDICRNRCPVQAQCLATALRNNLVGIWGGTTYSQRRVLLRSRSRARCIRCEGRWIVHYGNSGVCVACGISWRVPSLFSSPVDNVKPLPTSPSTSTRFVR